MQPLLSHSMVFLQYWVIKEKSIVRKFKENPNICKFNKKIVFVFPQFDKSFIKSIEFKSNLAEFEIY